MVNLIQGVYPLGILICREICSSKLIHTQVESLARLLVCALDYSQLLVLDLLGDKSGALPSEL